MKVVIFGINQFAELLYFNLENDEKFEVVAFVVDNKYRKEDSFCGKPVVDFENVNMIYAPEEHGMFICIGYKKMNTIRQEKHKAAQKKGYKIMNYIHPSAIVQSKDIGIGTIIFEGVIIGPFTRIGEGNVFYPKVHIAHHTIIGDFNFFAISCAIAGNVLIGDNCFLGNNCTLKNDISIANLTLVGAAAYIGSDTSEPCGVYIPSPSIRLNHKNSIDLDLTKRK